MAPQIDVDRDAIARFCRQNRIRWMALFGSVLRDDFRQDSDVDVLVDFEPETRIGLVGLAQLELDLEDLFGRQVDLSTFEGLNPHFRDRVLAEARDLYAA
ncbi:MAG: nucleotidyltransferase family protein [Armatimonadetes bacterium]|nr:nucleotidyltransferase family protein [Armatimonadota bacterium]